MEKWFRKIEQSLLIFSIALFITGVFSASFFNFDFNFLLFIVFISLVIFFYAKLTKHELTKSIVILVVAIISFSAGALRYESKNIFSSDDPFFQDVGKNISIDAFVVSEPVSKENYRSYVIKVKGSDSKILVRAELYPEFKYGDFVKFSGRLDAPKNFQTEGEREFDYISYLGKDNIRYILSFARGEFLSGGHGNKVKSSLYFVKNAFLSNINAVIAEPKSGLLAGILLGVDSLSKNLEDAFRSTGIIHIVVLSGYNITIVAENLTKFFSFLPKNFSAGLGAIGVILFAIMSGGSPSVVRASIMALLVIVARRTGRTYAIGRTLLLAGFLMVLWNPNILAFDLSFELSFLSTVALIWISPLVEERLRWIPEKYGLRDVTSATISTQIFVLPLLLYKIGQFSVVGLPVNLLVLGVVPTLMFFGFLTGAVGFISNGLSMIFGFVSDVLLSYILKVVEIFSSLSFASFHISRFSAIFMWFCYGAFLFAYFKLIKLKKEAGNRVNPANSKDFH